MIEERKHVLRKISIKRDALPRAYVTLFESFHVTDAYQFSWHTTKDSITLLKYLYAPTNSSSPRVRLAKTASVIPRLYPDLQNNISNFDKEKCILFNFANAPAGCNPHGEIAGCHCSEEQIFAVGDFS